MYITLYKSTVNAKNLDRSMKKFLMKYFVQEMHNDTELTYQSRGLLRSRANELKPETLRLIVASGSLNLFHATMDVMPHELLLRSIETPVLRESLSSLPDEKFEPLIPKLLEMAKTEEDDEYSMSSNIHKMLNFAYTWEHGRQIKRIARAMLGSSHCTPAIFMELTHRFPSLSDVAPGSDHFNEWLKTRKIKIVEGDNYGTGE